MKIRVLYFVGQCLSLDDHPTFRETIIAQFSNPDYDWDDFIWICSNHLVLPVIYLKFRAHDLLNELPEVLKKHLEEIYALNRSRNEQILLQMKEITATLNSADISPIFMKGTGNLIDGIYNDIGERIIGDIDFLVPEEDFLTSAELLKKEGYAICKPTFEPIDQFQLKHYPRLWKADVVADIEIHRLLVNIKYSTHFSAELVQRSERAVIDFPGCYVLADEHKAILSFIHSQLINPGHALGIVTLRDIYDIYCFSRRVNLQKIPQVTQFRQKCIAYFKLSEKLLNLPGRFYSGETIQSRLYCFKHYLNISSGFICKANRLIWVLSEGIGFVIRWFTESFSNSTFRRKNINKLFTPEWHWRNLKIGWVMYRGKSKGQ